jgi:hypothetical protein
MGNGGSGSRARGLASQRGPAAKASGSAQAKTFRAGAARNFINESAVKSWTKGNAAGVPSIVYRATNDTTYAEKMRTEGIDVTHQGRSSLFQGAYFLARPAHESQLGTSLYGEHQVRVAVRMQNPMRFDQKSWGQFARQVAKKLSGGLNDPGFGAAATRAVLARGHDGIIRETGLLGDKLLDHEIIAVVPGSVRVIREGTATSQPRASRAKKST